MIILKRILYKQGVNMWNGFNWLGKVFQCRVFVNTAKDIRVTGKQEILDRIRQ